MTSDYNPPRSIPEPIEKHGHPRGKLSSWIIVLVITAAFAIGGVALVFNLWWLFWTCAGVVALSIPAAGLIGIMDDTVAWGHAVPEEYQGGSIIVAAVRDHEAAMGEDGKPTDGTPQSKARPFDT